MCKDKNIRLKICNVLVEKLQKHMSSIPNDKLCAILFQLSTIYVNKNFLASSVKKLHSEYKNERWPQANCKSLLNLFNACARSDFSSPLFTEIVNDNILKNDGWTKDNIILFAHPASLMNISYPYVYNTFFEDLNTQFQP
eukprot:UN34354